MLKCRTLFTEGSSMHKRIAELVELLEQTRARLLDTVASANPEWLEKGPSEGRWSVAEVIDHLATVESGIARLLMKMIDRAGDDLPPETSEESVLERVERLDLQNRTVRIEAPDGVRPRQGVSLEEARRALDDARVALDTAIAKADGRAIGTLSFPHRLFGQLDGYQWLLFVAEHEERHRRQIAAMARQEE
jgi:uncharacterized damage-inducible protein DinB